MWVNDGPYVLLWHRHKGNLSTRWSSNLLFLHNEEERRSVWAVLGAENQPVGFSWSISLTSKLSSICRWWQWVSFTISDLVLTSHDDVLRFRHHATLLGDQGVPLRSWQAVGGEEAIVLLHAHGSSGQLTAGIVHGQGTSAATYLLFTHHGIMETFLIASVRQLIFPLTQQARSCTPKFQRWGGQQNWQMQIETTVFSDCRFVYICQKPVQNHFHC